MESIIRHCSVMNPKDFVKANDLGDDVFLCEYEYDIHWHSFKRIADIDKEEVNILKLEALIRDSESCKCGCSVGFTSGRSHLVGS